MQEKTRFLKKNEQCINPNVVDTMLGSTSTAFSMVGIEGAEVADGYVDFTFTSDLIDADWRESYVDRDTLLTIPEDELLEFLDITPETEKEALTEVAISGNTEDDGYVTFVLDEAIDFTVSKINGETVLKISEVDLAEFLGITEDIILSGSEICGVAGTVEPLPIPGGNDGGSN